MPLATSIVDRAPLYRGNVALQPFNLTKERLSQHRGCTLIYFEPPAINSRYANA
jgi:hypothetical protein